MNLPAPIESGRTIRKELSKRGYEVLFSNVSYCGVPESIIVGGEHGKMHKDDFYRVAGKLGLFFKSGDFYIDYAESKEKIFEDVCLERF